MIVWAPGLEMGVGRFSRPLRGVGVLAMPDAELDTTRRAEFICKDPPGVGVQRLLVPSLVVGEFIDCCSVVDGVEVTR